jgi:enoyl-CoA hydratase/carnithine racemase
MPEAAMTESVLFSTIPTASGHVFARATLNAPASLNALSLDMIDGLAARLDAWMADPQVVGVVLDAAGGKAFCAGGDVVALLRSIRETPRGAVPGHAAAFFEREYRLDHRIHTSPKPVLCWGHGIVMGGGIGLMAGASHRVVTARTKLAMPEITIGLYPDVGGSWVLGRAPGRSGLFLALTGAPLNASDARFAGLADFQLRHEDHGAVLEAIATEAWSGRRDDDDARLSHLLQAREHGIEAPASPLRANLDRIDAAIGRDRLDDIAPRLHALANDGDPWLAAAATAFAKGAPSSARLAFEMQRRARHLSLADVFRLEWQASVGCCMHGDFAEGVRALLVDKDKSPRWQPATLAEADDALVDALLAPRFAGAHPLADLR